MVEKTKISYKGKSKNVPKKYVSTLKGEEKKKQVKSILEKSSAPRPKTSAPQRRSTWTIKFEKQYGEQLDKMKGGRSKKNIAKVTGIPFKAIDEVYKKGEGAYKSSGSRPNQTAQSWARGRIYGYIMGNKKVRKVDQEITDKYKVKFKF